jgi:hypothetical protein
MSREKTCTSPECRSDEVHRKLYSLERCRNCYMRQYRSRKASRTDSPQNAIDTAQVAFQGYVKRNRPVLRRLAIQKLLDQGKTLQEVILAFSKKPELLELVGPGDPIRALKRDLAALEAEQQGKSASQRMLERQIRQTREQLEIERLPSRDKARLYLHLHQLERELALSSMPGAQNADSDEDREAQLQAAFEADAPPPLWYVDNGKDARYYDRAEGKWDYRLPHVT